MEHPVSSRRSFLRTLPLATAAGTLAVSARLVGRDGRPGPPPEDPRTVHLRFRGGHGNANFFRACAYVAEGMRSRFSADSTFSIVLGTSYKDNVDALRNGDVEFATIVPPALLRWALDGICLFDRPFREARLVTVFPSMEWLTIAAAPELRIRSLEELADRKSKVRLGVGRFDGWDAMTYIAEEVLKAYGVSFEEIRQWGGTVRGGHVREIMPRVQAGEIDMFIQEARLSQQVHDMPAERRWVLLPLSEAVASSVGKRLHLEPVVLEPGTRTGVRAPYQTLDLSDYELATRTDVPDEIVYLAARSAVENRKGFESNYTHLPVEISNLTYPMVPSKMWKSRGGVPLHPAAEKYYREAGLM